MKIGRSAVLGLVLAALCSSFALAQKVTVQKSMSAYLTSKTVIVANGI
jgi:hypothetical protein